MDPLRFFLHLLVALSVLGPFQGPIGLPVAHSLVLHAQQDPATVTVYITKTGEKYHRDGCRYLSRSRIPISLKDAVRRGYGPCSVCRPPTATAIVDRTFARVDMPVHAW